MASSLLIDGASAPADSPQSTLAGAREALGESWFETIRVTGGEPELLEEHLQRLAASTEFDRDALISDIQRGIDEVGGGDVFVRLMAGPAGRIVATGPLPPHADDPAPAKVTMADIPDYAYPAKSTDFQLQLGLLDQAAADGFDDVLITDGGFVIEAARANLLLIDGDTLRTPPLGRCLPGVIRAALVELAPRAGLRVSEEPVRVNHVLAADEVLITNSIIRARMVSEVDGVPVGGRAREAVESLRVELAAKIQAA